MELDYSTWKWVMGCNYCCIGFCVMKPKLNASQGLPFVNCRLARQHPKLLGWTT